MASYRQYRHQSSSDFGRPRPVSFEMDPFTRWQLSGLPIAGDYLRAMDQQKFYNDYLRGHNMTWNDVKYPALLGGQNAVGAGVNTGYSIMGAMVSRNLLKLYR